MALSKSREELFFGLTSDKDLAVTCFMEKADTTRDDYINMVRVFFCLKGRAPVNCYIGQLELFFLMSSSTQTLPADDVRVFTLLRYLSVHQFECSHLFMPLNLAFVCNKVQAIDLALRMTGMNRRERSKKCQFMARNALMRYNFFDGFTLQNSCIQSITAYMLERVRRQFGVAVFFSGLGSIPFLKPVESLIYQLPLPDIMLHAVRQSVIGTLCPSHGRMVFHCAECPLFRIFLGYAHGIYTSSGAYDPQY